MKRGMRTQKYTSSSAGTKRSSLPPIPRKNGKQKAKLSIRQAIDEALDDYTAEHIKEYSHYDSELTPLSPVKDVVFQEVEPIPSADDTKRRHSFDLQVTKSPILDAMKDKQVVAAPRTRRIIGVGEKSLPVSRTYSLRLDCWVTCSVRFPGDVESALRHPLFRILDIGHSRQVDDVSEAGERHPPTFSGRGRGGGNASEATRFGEGGQRGR